MDIVSSSAESGKAELVDKLANDLIGFVHRSIDRGVDFANFESNLFQRLLQAGQKATDLFLSSQGNGDLGETVCTANDVVLYRSPDPQAQSLRSIFGQHSFESFVYTRGAKQKIELRPIAAQLNLPEHKASYLFQEFSQLFCVEKAFGVAAKQFERIFGQKVSVAVLEDGNPFLWEASRGKPIFPGKNPYFQYQPPSCTRFEPPISHFLDVFQGMERSHPIHQAFSHIEFLFFPNLFEDLKLQNQNFSTIWHFINNTARV